MASIKCLLLALLCVPATLTAKEYTDSLGRKVAVEKTPARVIAVGPGAARLVAYLGAVDLLVATENIEIKLPEGRPYTLAYRERLAALPVIGEGGPDKAPDYERIIGLKPDLIVACSLESQLVAALAAKTGVPVFSADYGSLGSFETGRFKKVLAVLGELLGRKERAAALNARIDGYVKDLARRSAKAAGKPSVYVGGLGFKGSHGITSTQLGYEPFGLLGLRNAPDGENARPLHIFIDREKLAKLDPEHIFLDAGGLGLIAGDYASAPGFYGLLKAFRGGTVYTTLPYNYYTTNVEIVFLNAYFTGKAVFPGQFSDVNMRAKAAEIFKVFVGRDVYDELAKRNEFYKKLRPGAGLTFEELR